MVGYQRWLSGTAPPLSPELIFDGVKSLQTGLSGDFCFAPLVFKGIARTRCRRKIYCCHKLRPVWRVLI